MRMKIRRMHWKALACIISICILSGCGNRTMENESSADPVNDSPLETWFDSITGDMLDACSSEPETIEAFDHDPLILLNWYRDDIRLYGINVGEGRKDEATLLYVQGEKVLLPYPYRNLYYDTPDVNVLDADEDGKEEVVISRRNGTGTPGYWFTLLIVDQENDWVIHEYDQCVEDIEALVEYRYQDTSDTLTFLNRRTGKVLTEIPLPDWTEEYPYTGKVEYANSIRYDVKTMQLQVEPWILLENSLPYWPVAFVFDIQYRNGEFEIEINDVQYVSMAMAIRMGCET